MRRKLAWFLGFWVFVIGMLAVQCPVRDILLVSVSYLLGGIIVFASEK